MNSEVFEFIIRGREDAYKLKTGWRATQKDLAYAAGVSVSTVSRALTGSKPVDEKTKAKIDFMVGAFLYQPNQLARDLRAMGRVKQPHIYEHSESQEPEEITEDIGIEAELVESLEQPVQEVMEDKLDIIEPIDLSEKPVDIPLYEGTASVVEKASIIRPLTRTEYYLLSDEEKAERKRALNLQHQLAWAKNHPDKAAERVRKWRADKKNRMSSSEIE